MLGLTHESSGFMPQTVDPVGSVLSAKAEHQEDQVYSPHGVHEAQGGGGDGMANMLGFITVTVL